MALPFKLVLVLTAITVSVTGQGNKVIPITDTISIGGVPGGNQQMTTGTSQSPSVQSASNSQNRKSVGGSCNVDEDCFSATCVFNTCCLAEGAACNGLKPGACCPGTQCRRNGICLSQVSAQRLLLNPYGK